MNLALWIVAGLLAVVYLGAGLMKATRPKDTLQPMLPWVEDFSAGTVRFIGVAEILGALGLVLPQATGIAPILTPIAAVGLVVVQVCAFRVHLVRDERQPLPANVLLLLLAAFVFATVYRLYFSRAFTLTQVCERLDTMQNSETADMFNQLSGDAADALKDMNRLCEVRRPMRQ
jgi:uncharacterized membrane protein